MPQRPRAVQVIGVGFFLAVATVATLAFAIPQVRGPLLAFLEWIRENEALGVFIYILTFVFGVVLLFPILILAVGAGFVFSDYYVAFAAVYAGSLIGVLVSFIVGRTLLKNTVQYFCIGRSRILNEMDQTLQTYGWKLIILLKVPYVALPHITYLLSACSTSHKDHFIASAISCIPGSLLFAYVGRSIQDLSSGALSGDGLYLTISGLVLAIVVFVALGVYACRAVAKAQRANLTINDEHLIINSDGTTRKATYSDIVNGYTPVHSASPLNGVAPTTAESESSEQTEESVNGSVVVVVSGAPTGREKAAGSTTDSVPQASVSSPPSALKLIEKKKETVCIVPVVCDELDDLKSRIPVAIASSVDDESFTQKPATDQNV